MGPIQRYLGPLVPAERLVWQDPVPSVDHELVGPDDVAALKRQVLDSGLGTGRLVATAWAAAASFRGSDKRGGANGARLRLEPQNGWEVNEPEQLAGALSTLEDVKRSFDDAEAEKGSGKKISLADLVVLAGCAAVERAARDGGHEVTVPFTPGRTDATPEMTDAASFDAMELGSDGFRNWTGKGNPLPAEYMLVDRANLLTLTAPEMTVLVGGLRVLGANHAGSSGRCAHRPPGHAEQRLLRQPARHGRHLDLHVAGPVHLRGARRLGAGALDRHPRRPGLRLQLRAAGGGGGLRQRRRAGQVRARLRARLGQGDDAGPVRPALSRSTAGDARTGPVAGPGRPARHTRR